MLPLEAVPNFSEGRDRATIDAIGDALARHARLLDVHTDADHNRSVYTLVGSEEELVAALLAGIACARERIDLRRHEGAHPRIGAADVVPIVPIAAEGRRAGAHCSARARAARGGGARAAGLPLRRSRDRTVGPRSSAAAARKSCSGGSTRGARPGLRPGAARRAGRRRDRRRTAAADRVQRQSRRRRPRRRTGGGARRPRARRRLSGRPRARPPPAAGRTRPGEPQRRGLARRRRCTRSSPRSSERLRRGRSRSPARSSSGCFRRAPQSRRQARSCGVAGLDPSHVLELRLLADGRE